ncbi:DNA polymerase I, partial [Candidatus Margulisiibacteriota bacterium]
SDADATIGLAGTFKKLLKEEKLDKLFYEVEMPLVSVLVELEKNGVYADCKKLNKISKEIDAEIKDLERNIFAMAGEEFNLNSPKQLQAILFEKLKLPIIKKTKTGASTDASVLEELAPKFEIAAKLSEYRQYAKIKSTYVDVLPELVRKDTGRIHANFNQTITATGRLSSSNPNMQNIPIRGKLGEKVRSAFVPQKKGWKILVADYSQVELRILAHMSGDEQLIKDFKEGKDIHRATAAEIFGVTESKVTDEMRSHAKAVNFGIVYGQSAFGLSKTIKIPKKEAQIFIDKYFNRYKGVKKFINKTIIEAREKGYVETLLGRKRELPDINSPNFSLKSFAERMAVNTPLQGTAADLIKVAMVNIGSQLTAYSSQLILQVHDELVFEVPDTELEKVEKLVKHEMENAIQLTVKAKVDVGVGESWGEAV